MVLAHHPFVKALPHIQAAEGDSVEALLRHAAHLIMAEIEKEPHIINMLFIELIELNGQHMPEVAAQMLPDVAQFFQRVQAVWKPSSEWTHAMDNIRYFKPIDEPDVPIEKIGKLPLSGWEG